MTKLTLDIKDEGITLEKYAVKPQLSKRTVEEAIRYVLTKIDESMAVFGATTFPKPASEGYVYGADPNIGWTPSFWTGMLWLAYEVTGDRKYRDIAEQSLATYQERLEKKVDVNTHDLGFLYSLSCVAAYKLTGNEEAKKTALQAADLLKQRYLDKAKIIQAWSSLDDPAERGRMIIDTNLNLPLLFWATEVTGDQSYHDIAYEHIKQSAKYLVREDASTFHTYYIDADTGEPIRGETHQGFADDSCWARGQAWGIYGLPLSYRYTGDWQLMETSEKLANYYLNRLPEDDVCYWDLIFTEGSEERDTSAAAIAVCGLLEHSRLLPLTHEYKSRYEHAALYQMKSLIENYTTKDMPHANGMLKEGVYAKSRNEGVNESCIWGDYYYFEALVRLIKDWKPYW